MKRGLLLTNSHCIDNLKSQVKVRVNHKWETANVIAKASNQETIDVCLLKL